jgi:hypothetical protein
MRRAVALAASFALHAAAVVTLAVESASLRPGTPRPGSKPRSMAVFLVPPEDDSAPPGLKALDPRDDLERPQRGSPRVSLPGFAFDVAKIESRAALLFPFVTPGLSLERFALAPRLQPRDTFRDPFAPPREARPRAAAKPPLAMGREAMQTLIDRAWSRRDRWTPFQRILQLADAHDADAGRLPALLHEYEAQNGLQPYVDTSIRDPRMWTELGLAADHVEFIGFISRYAAEHPSTRATTELLFLLDKIAQASFDALATLLDTIPDAQLEWTRDANRDAFEFIVDVRRHYGAVLRRKGIESSEALTSFYERARLDILTGILRTTPHGYRANDARFLIGSIYWRQGQEGDALRAWRAMTIDPADEYAASIARIRGAIAAETGSDRGNVDTGETMRRLALQINAILRGEHGRWIMFSLDRLHQFGFRFDTF